MGDRFKNMVLVHMVFGGLNGKSFLPITSVKVPEKPVQVPWLCIPFIPVEPALKEVETGMKGIKK